MSEIITPDMFGNYLEAHYRALWIMLKHHKTHTNKNMTLKGHMYLKEILMDQSRHRVVMKATQGGVSEALIIITWDAAEKGYVVFYVLPTHELRNRFVGNRFEKSIAYTPFYQQHKGSGISKSFKLDAIDNKSLKDIGKGIINFAGSQSDVPFIEIPADWFVVDEADSCDIKRLEMGKERLGHSSDPHEVYVGNPTVVGSFLDEKYQESTMGLWTIKAECGHEIQIDFFDHVVRQVDEHDYIIRDPNYDIETGSDIMPVCDTCGKPFDRFLDGTYVPRRKALFDGKQISRLFSGTSTLTELTNNFSKALLNPYRMQRFYNSDLGLPYTAEGAKVSFSMLDANRADYLMPATSENPCVMGVDVGNDLHVRINRLLPDKKKQAVFIGKVKTLQELFSLCTSYNVIAAVIDALPEIRLSRQFSHSMSGYFRCFFGGDKMDNINPKEKTITASRTLVMDEMKEMILKNEILLPKNLETLDEYKKHMSEPTRTWDEDKEAYVWASNRDDHFFLAETYCCLAEKILKFMK